MYSVGITSKYNSWAFGNMCVSSRGYNSFVSRRHDRTP